MEVLDMLSSEVDKYGLVGWLFIFFFCGLLSLVAVPASARTGAEGNKLIWKETNFCKCRVSSSMIGQKIRNKIGESILL